MNGEHMSVDLFGCLTVHTTYRHTVDISQQFPWQVIVCYLLITKRAIIVWL